MSELRPVAADALADFDRQPQVARLEADTFCEGCGYNLFSQAVRRDARTQLLLCRCPECGRFHVARDGATVGRVWLQRLGTLALVTWIVLLLHLGLGAVAGQFGLTLATLEELTTWQQVSQPTTQPALRSGSAVYYPTMQRVPRTNVPYYGAFMALMLALTFTLGFILALLLVTALHHWRRAGYFVPVVLAALGGGALAAVVSHAEWPLLFDWALAYILALAAANLAGGVVGIYLGRPFARLVVTLALPPRVRQVLAFLWLADGKPPPKVKR